MEEKDIQNHGHWVIALRNLVFFGIWNNKLFYKTNCIQEPFIILLPLLKYQCAYNVFSCCLMQASTKGKFCHAEATLFSGHPKPNKQIENVAIVNNIFLKNVFL